MKKDRPFNKTQWDQLWKDDSLTPCAYEEIVEKERRSVRYNQIRNIILKQFGSFSGRKVIEIGAGRGTVALLMAQEGALVTLLDLSETALKQATLLFNQFGIQAEYLHGDLFQLPQEHLERYDISMSFGLGEHFLYPMRQEVVNAHASVLKKRGLILFGVPSKWSPSYQIYKGATKIIGKWHMGLEVPFTRHELRRCIHNAGLHYLMFIGSSWTADLDYFLFSNIAKFFRKMCHIPKMERQTIIQSEKPSRLDAYLGYGLVIIGQK